MNKNIYTFAVLFCFLLGIFASCSDNDDDSTDYVWKARNEKLFDEAASTYTSMLNSESKNGFIRFNKVSESNSNLKTAKDGTIQFSDSVTVRYEGWYIDADGNKTIFDSTESNNKVPITSAVSNTTIFTDGHATMLQNMKEGEEVEMCIPYKLAYGASGRTNTTTGTTYLVPPYTTVYYYMKVVKVIPCNPGEFN